MAVLVKICGLNDEPGLDAAVEAGADMVGFVFYPPSPRGVTPARAATLSARHDGGPLRVGLFVDPSDDEVAATLDALPLDILQLHGRESPKRCAELRARHGRPVMKALGIASRDDLARLAAYASAVDRFLLDAKPPPGATLPGGNAGRFDWGLLAGQDIPRPWMLAGGLDLSNVAEALRLTGAPGLDLSSGVERSRGVKDPGLIRAFMAEVRAIGGSAPS